jgi:hypothetical protein
MPDTDSGAAQIEPGHGCEAIERDLTRDRTHDLRKHEQEFREFLKQLTAANDRRHRGSTDLT